MTEPTDHTRRRFIAATGGLALAAALPAQAQQAPFLITTSADTVLPKGKAPRVVICGAVSNYNAARPEGPRRLMALIVARASMKGFLVLDYEDRYSEAIEGIGEMIRSGRLHARETIVPGGVPAFPEALLGIFRGINTGKLVLKV